MREKIILFLKKFPSIHRLLQNFYWKFLGCKARILGTRLEERKWAKRHLYPSGDWNERDKDWVKSYWNSRNHPHRIFLLKKVSKFSPISSILEIGCNCGPNLCLIAKRFPNIEIRGIDINPMAVQRGNELFAKEDTSNVRLLVGKADELNQFPDKRFDVVFTDATLIYIGPDKIKKVIREMFRISRKALILVEWHENSEKEDPQGLGIYHFGHWKRNYLNLLKQFVGEEQIRLTKIPEEIWPNERWGNLGYIIEVLI